MKKLLFAAAALLLMGSCSDSSNSKKDNQDMDPVESVDTTIPTEELTPNEEQAQSESSHQDVNVKEEKKADKANAKYDSMLDKYESLIKKCWSMSKKGLSINDQELADVWMKAGDMGSKLDKANKSLSPEQQNRLKKLNKDFKKFCQSQPA